MPPWVREDLWIVFQLIFWMALVFIIGKTLARKGDLVGKVTGMTGSWVGLVLLACATSMPEMITGVATAGIVKKPDLALGNIFGSCLFNLAILAFLDFLDRKNQTLRSVRSSQVLPAMLGVFMIGIGVAGVWAVSPGRLPASWSWAFSGALLVGYAFCIHKIYRQGQDAEDEPPVDVPPGTTKARALVEFGLWSGALVFTAIQLSQTGDTVSTHGFIDGKVHVGASFVGGFLLAAATSLPELSVSIEAARIGAYDMSVGNVLGSNLFNLAVIPICEVAAWLGGGPVILYGASPTNLVTGGVSIFMTLLIIAVIRRPPKLKVGWMGIESIILLGVYVAASLAIFLMG